MAFRTNTLKNFTTDIKNKAIDLGAPEPVGTIHPKDLDILMDSIPTGGNDKFSEYLKGTLTELTESDFEGVSVLRNYEFSNLDSLQSIHIPRNITDVRDYVFQLCDNLEDIYWDATNTNSQLTIFHLSGPDTGANVIIGKNCVRLPVFGNFTSASAKEIKSLIFEMPSSVAILPENVFYNCFPSSVFNGPIILPNTIIEIGRYAFSACSGITEINIPTEITIIPQRCFNACSSLLTITIPNSITNIETYAFAGSGLKTVKLLPINPPILANTNAFPSGVTTFEVPIASLEAYQTATNWSSYASKMVGV